MKSRHMHRVAVRRHGLTPLFREFAIFYYRWALREINPMHPDVPRIVRRLRELLDMRGPEPLKAAWRWL
jgi:hypothetical protein